MDPVSQLCVALDTTGQVLDGVGEQQWAGPTPCPDWDVSALASHVVIGNLRFAGALAGRLSAVEPAPAGVSLPQAYRESAAALLAAFSEPGALERTVTVPFGTVPGTVALHLRVTELLVHGWDLARATGQTVTFPEDLAAAELDFTVRLLPQVPPDRSPFGPPQPAALDAPAIDRLAAMLGRRVGGPAAGSGA